MVSPDDLARLENATNEEFSKANLPVRIKVLNFKETPTWALEHNLMYSKIVSHQVSQRVWEIVGEQFEKWRKALGIGT